uniref:Uncharacterized protein n=1 Tax=Timema cristinae TaxID=61476 RepID=A0A7R9D0C2_TIMCR|nr:unnamed protein product [Timema cristinae]
MVYSWMVQAETARVRATCVTWCKQVQIRLIVLAFDADSQAAVTVNSHVRRKTSAEPKRSHLMSSKPIIRYPPHRRELFC